MYNATNIGAAITGLRMEMGLKQKKLSKMLHISQSNLCNYENGVYRPGLDTLCRLADIFNVTTDYLLGRTGYRCPPETLEQYINPDYKMRHIINLLLSLDANSLDAVVKFADYLKSTATPPANSKASFPKKT